MRLANANMELSYMDQETRMYDAINNLLNSRIALEQNKYLRQKEIVNLEYQIDLAKKDFQRKEMLYKENVTTLKEFEDAKRDFDFTLRQLEISLKLQKLDSIATEDQRKQINASVNRMQNNLSLLQVNMKKLLVKAPASGQLSSFNPEIGQTIPAGDRIGQIDLMDGYKMRANIDERYITRITNGQSAEFDFSGQVYKLFVGKIYSEVAAGTFQVDLFFEGNPPDNIVRGQTLQIKLILSSPSDAIIVQRGGFFQDTGGNWIYVLDPSESYAIKRDIRLGRQNTKFYEVLEGLEPGEKVIVSSYAGFGNKDKVILK
jgi:HlyD family secretion protein